MLHHARTYAEDTPGNAREREAGRKIRDEESFCGDRQLPHAPGAGGVSMVMPDVELAPFPVSPPGVEVAEWSDYPGTASLFMEEYNKLLFSYIKAALHHIFRSAPEHRPQPRVRSHD